MFEKGIFESIDDDTSSKSIDMRNRRVKQYQSPIEASEAPVKQPKKPSLDSEEMLDLHGVLLGLYRRELGRQFNHRAEMAIDEDFYDSIQWDEWDAQKLRDREQLPLVYNVVSTTINWVTGTQKRSRVDYKVLPRRKEDGKPAERKTALLKYLSDVNRSPFHRSRAFEDALKVGVGWLECGVEETDSSDPVYSRYESWRNMLWDSAATEDDLGDARFVSRSKWVDVDIVKSMFPKRKTLIDESIDQTQIYSSSVEQDGDEPMDDREIAAQQDGLLHKNLAGGRPRVRLIEMWFRRPVQSYRMIGGQFAGDLYDFSNAHDADIQSGKAIIEKKPTMRMFCVLMTARGLLFFGESPYRHNRFPFTPVWGYRRGRDGMPYGMIRGVRDIQIDVNKRAAKALAIMCSNKVVMDEDALPDDVSMDEFADEVSRPNAIIRKKSGRDLTINADRDLAAVHLELMSRSINMIQQQSGITDELMGQSTNAVSGVAIGKRQGQGTIVTTNLFDRLRFAMQVHGEKELSLIEQFYTEQKQFRITSMRGAPEYVTLNSGLPEDDITRSKADFVISDADWHASLRQSAVESLMQALNALAPTVPQLALAMIDLIVENMDLPNREEIVRRIRAVTGLPDPDAEAPTQEMLAAARAKQMAQAMRMATEQANLQAKQANAAKAAAQAKAEEAKATLTLAQIKHLLVQATDQSVDTQGKAIDAAVKLITAGDHAAPVADHLLREAGFEGAPEQQAKAQKLMDMTRRPMPQQPMPNGGLNGGH